MSELTPGILIHHVIERRDAIAPVDDLAEELELLGYTAEQFDVISQETVDAGVLITCEDMDGRQGLTFTPFGAAIYQIRLTDDSTQWVPEYIPEPPNQSHWDGSLPVARAPVAGWDFDSEDFAIVINPADAAIAAEAVEKYAKELERAQKPRWAPPRARIFLGIYLPWPLSVLCPCCPGCGNRTLGLIEYCLWCDRSGADKYLPAVKATERPNGRKQHIAGALKGGIGA